MRYRLLGKSGLRVSELCLGTMTFGEDWGWGSSKEESRKVYDAFLEAGGNFIDTANIYTNGTSETFLGEFIQGHRERLVLATKYTNAMPGTDPNAAGNQRKNMMQAVEASLKRLQTDYIDLYWLHIWDQITPHRGGDAGLRRPRAAGQDPLCRESPTCRPGSSPRRTRWPNCEAGRRSSGLQIEYSLIERTAGAGTVADGPASGWA